MNNSFKSNIIRPISDISKLYFYQKAHTLYLMTYNFISRFIQFDDRTRDQMLQAARSGKQNIVEGTADGATSIEMEIQLLNVSRASLKELKEDYRDYLLTRNLTIWDKTHLRFTPMLNYCRKHNNPDDYVNLFPKLNDEEMANLAITFTCQIDVMMHAYQNKLMSSIQNYTTNRNPFRKS